MSAVTKLRSSGLGSIFAILFVDLVGFGIVFPLYAAILAYYGRQDHGLLHWMMEAVATIHPGADAGQRAALFGGLLGAIYAGLQFFAAPFWGRLSDRIGRRPVLLISLVGSLLANVVWIFAGSFAILLFARLLAGVTTGNVAVANAAVADITTPENRSRGMAAVGMAFGLGFILGPALGGACARIDFTHLFPAMEAWGINPFSAAAAFATLLALGNLLWTWRSFRETLPPERRAAVPPKIRPTNPLTIFRGDMPPRVYALSLAFGCHTLLFSGMEFTLVFLADQRLHMDPLHFGLLLGYMGLLSALVQGGFFRPYGARFGVHRMAALGFILHVPGFALLGCVDQHQSFLLLAAGATIQALATGLVFPGLATLLSLAAPPERQGHAMGTFRSASALGRALGPLLGALAYFVMSPAAPYWIGAVGILLPLWLLIRIGADPGTATRLSPSGT